MPNLTVPSSDIPNLGEPNSGSLISEFPNSPIANTGTEIPTLGDVDPPL